MRTFNHNTLAERRWDSEALGLVKKIHEFKGKRELHLKQRPAVLKRQAEIAKIRSTEVSNLIW